MPLWEPELGTPLACARLATQCERRRRGCTEPLAAHGPAAQRRRRVLKSCAALRTTLSSAGHSLCTQSPLAGSVPMFPRGAMRTASSAICEGCPSEGRRPVPTARTPGPAAASQAAAAGVLERRARTTVPAKPKPAIRSAQLAGSGTAAWASKPRTKSKPVSGLTAL